MVRGLADPLLTTARAGRGTTPVLVLGDLDDEPAAASTQILYGPPGSQPDTAGFAHPDRGDTLRLWDLAHRIPADQRFTRIVEGHGELIDHIRVRHTLLDPSPTSSDPADRPGPATEHRRGPDRPPRPTRPRPHRGSRPPPALTPAPQTDTVWLRHPPRAPGPDDCMPSAGR
jgi:hypothetical protein